MKTIMYGCYFHTTTVNWVVPTTYKEAYVRLTEGVVYTFPKPRITPPYCMDENF